MKAVVCNAWGPLENLRYQDFPSPVLGAGQVRIGIHAAGLNFSDALKAQGRHQVNVPPPFVPGSEMSGVVLEVGDGVTSVRVGDRVIGVGTKHGGGYADEVVLDAYRVLRMPAGMSHAEGAAFPSVYGTALYSLKQSARLQPGETLLVLGAAGGAGLSAVQVGAALGARVIAAASSEAKRALARSHGAAETIDYTGVRLRDAVRELTDGRGADIVFDPVGGSAFEEATHCIAWQGRLLVVGFASGNIPSLRMNLPLVKGFQVHGIRYDVWRDSHWQEAQDNFDVLLDWVDRGTLRPHVGRTYPIAEAVAALHDMTGRQATGKTVLLTERGQQSQALP